MSFQIPPEIEERVKEHVASGHYGSEQELFDDALRALDAMKAQQDELRREIQDRVSKAGTGASVPLDRAAFQSEARRRAVL